MMCGIALVHSLAPCSQQKRFDPSPRHCQCTDDEAGYGTCSQGHVFDTLLHFIVAFNKHVKINAVLCVTHRMRNVAPNGAVSVIPGFATSLVVLSKTQNSFETGAYPGIFIGCGG
jgi:hypothetical protein